jgi:hypothetical protein
MTDGSWEHIAITAVVVPLSFLIGGYLIRSKDAKIKTLEDTKDAVIKESLNGWHTSVDGKFTEILNKVSRFCEDNRNEHSEFYTARGDHDRRIGEIETIHRMNGCDQPRGPERRINT